MSGYKCPFCGEIMALQKETISIHKLTFGGCYSYSADIPCLEIDIFKCPNDDCQKESIIAEGLKGYIDNTCVSIYPRTRFHHFPDYVPAAIRCDYEEACSVLEYSPKAAATLARRCLQGMIHDFWDIREKNLNAEITQLKTRIPANQWKAIDAVRSIGNIGAHMEHNVNLIIDVDIDEARKLVRLIEHLIEKWYVDRHDTEELYSELAAIGQEKSDARKK